MVTGGGRGIGRGVALELARRGARVAINYRRDDVAAAAAVEEIQTLGVDAIAIQGSLSAGDEVDAVAETLLGTWGDVDILVHNAGIASRGHSVADTDPAEVERLIDTHAIGAHRLTQRLLPTLRRQPRADVIAISSSELLHMRAGGGPYNMAKAALEAFALTLAHEEITNGIRVNIVAPGLVITDMGVRLLQAKLGGEPIDTIDARQPLGRVVRPVDVGRVVAFLVSEDAAFMTGQRIVVDGGTDASPTGTDDASRSVEARR